VKTLAVGPYSNAILQALKHATEPLSLPLLARVLHDGFEPPIKPLAPVLAKLEAAGLVEHFQRAGRGKPQSTVTVWALVRGAKYRVKAYTKMTADDLD
jgi:hypothetical protein